MKTVNLKPILISAIIGKNTSAFFNYKFVSQFFVYLYNKHQIIITIYIRYFNLN